METYGFDRVDEHPLTMLGVVGRRYRHASIGTEVLVLAGDEPNLSFAVGFPTLPTDDTGVAHILEHMVLAGSERFPLKDPFFEMVKGSLAGFLNAFTYPDRTVYPFATENERDYLNLLDVYLDAVFRPRLLRTTFEQEGWHVEWDAESEALRLHGVVYNEMKGAVADPGRALAYAESGALFADIPYRFDSGGDPDAIPDLSYESLVAFHAANYHPSRARFVLHGTVPLEATLARIARYLEQVAPIPMLAPPPLQPAFSTPQQAQSTYPADAKGRALASVAWALPALEGPGETLVLDLLDHVLVGTPASPLRRALLDAGLGEAFLGGLDTTLRHPTFRAGLRGVEVGRTAEVHTLVLDTLRDLATRGFDPADVLAARNRLEFDLREMDGQGGQRGLSLALDVLGGWLHGRDPLRELDFDAALADLAARLGNSSDHGASVLQDLLRVTLLDNAHRVATTVLPDPGWSEAREVAEKERLAARAANLGPDERSSIVAAAATLHELQHAPDSPEARATLPRLHRSDLNDIRPDPLTAEHPHGKARILHVELPTRGLVYVDVGFDLSTVPTRALPLVPLLRRFLLETGTRSRSLAELTRAIDTHTGGIDAGYDLMPGSARGVPMRRFFVRGRALASKAQDLMDLMREVLLEARFDDVASIRTLALETLARRRASLERAGHRYALRRLATHDSVEGRAEEAMVGLAGLASLQAFVDACATDPDTVMADLEALRTQLITTQGVVVGVTADAASAAKVVPVIRSFLDALPSSIAEPQDWSLPVANAAEGWTLPGQVNYVATTQRLHTDGGSVSGGLLIASRWLSSEVLLPRIRFEGGAYGAGAFLEPLRGIFRTYSYRDPNLERTLDIVAEAPRLLRSAGDHVDELEFETLLIGAVGSLDPYDAPAERGYRTLVRWLRGTQDQPAVLRREMLASDRSVFATLADAIERGDTQKVVVLGPASRLAAAQAPLRLELHEPG